MFIGNWNLVQRDLILDIHEFLFNCQYFHIFQRLD